MIKAADMEWEIRPVHELGITDQLLMLTLKHAEQAGAVRVVRLRLLIGEFSSVVDESIQFYWDMMTEGTIAEGAELCFAYVPGKLACADCGEIVLFGDYDGRCPGCGGTRLSTHDGSQFRLESIEVEGADIRETNP
jgi:hydrogenase nickel incorporation protein HypA/HybF